MKENQMNEARKQNESTETHKSIIGDRAFNLFMPRHGKSAAQIQFFSLSLVCRARRCSRSSSSKPRNNAHFFFDQFLCFILHLPNEISISTAQYDFEFIIAGVTFCWCCRCGCYRFHFSYVSNHIYRQFIHPFNSPFLHLIIGNVACECESVCVHIYFTPLCITLLFILSVSVSVSFPFSYFSLQESIYRIVRVLNRSAFYSFWSCFHLIMLFLCVCLCVHCYFGLLLLLAAVFSPPLYRRLHNWIMFI